MRPRCGQAPGAAVELLAFGAFSCEHLRVSVSLRARAPARVRDGVRGRGAEATGRLALFAAALAATVLAGAARSGAAPPPAAGRGTAPRGATAAAGDGRAAAVRVVSSPIRHVVVIDQENHSFDNVLGALCHIDARCDGAVTGKVADGSTIPLPRADDIVPEVAHSHGAQVKAIDGGAMDGFSTLSNCTRTKGYPCYQQFLPGQIPNLAALARAFVISDRTFESGTASSWGSHLELVAATLDGFTGDNPVTAEGVAIPSGGCDQDGVDAAWRPPHAAGTVMVPSCIPFPDGTGAYRPTPVPWVPTIMDRLDAAGLSWRLYTGNWPDSPVGYGWPVCPTFADCIFTSQRQHLFPADQLVVDAAAGALPAFSVVTPTVPDSQHNSRSMLRGDNWIARAVSAIESGPGWGTTAVFVTYDDCGCFYDHVPPPNGLGIRVPMVIVSPYARARFTDSGVASFDSVLAFVEQTFGLKPLGRGDGRAYAYADSFDFGQAPLAPVRLRVHRLPAAERRWLAAHPGDPDDPT
jgi:phospholipase C